MLLVKKTTTISMALAMICIASRAQAAPPLLRPVDVPTIYQLAEGARAVAREQTGDVEVEDPLNLKVIVIDPGHGGENDGAVGVAGVHEKILTLELAYELRDAIEARHPDATVLLTRYWDRDVDLDARTRWANDIGADLFVSLHYNAATHDRAVGYETYFLSEEVMATTSEAGDRWKQPTSKTAKRAGRLLDKARVKAHNTAREPLVEPFEHSKHLAALVQAELAERLETPNRGVKQANFAVLRGALMPAVVVESGFLTHPAEGTDVLTRRHRAQIVEALIEAIDAFDDTLDPAPEASPEVAQVSDAP